MQDICHLEILIVGRFKWECYRQKLRSGNANSGKMPPSPFIFADILETLHDKANELLAMHVPTILLECQGGTDAVTDMTLLTRAHYMRRKSKWY